MKYPLIIAILFSSTFSFAQYNPASIDKKAVNLYNKALQTAQDYNFKDAIQILKQAADINNNYADAYLSMAGMYGELKDYPNAVASYEKAKAIDSNYFKDYNLPYSINLAGTGQFQKALDAVNVFLTINKLNDRSRKSGEYRQKCYSFAIDYEKNKKIINYKFEPQNLGDSINTELPEYCPAITIDGSKLIFTRRVNHDNMDNEDFYESDWVNGHWTKAKNLAGNINTNMNEGAGNISQDGQWLIFTGCLFPDGYGSCDLYISYLTTDGWSTPENLGNRVNTEFRESSPSLSPDKRDLYFTSNRPGGYGGNDLYVSHRMASGNWSEPENLGAEINTVGDESAPFIHADNQSLYFTSSGQPGYGGDDIFVSRKDSAGNWGKAENLGYPINTIDDEGSMIVAADGKTAYFSGQRPDTRGKLDLYTFELRSDVRPAKTLWVKGKVFDQKTNKGLPSAVELTDLSTKQIISIVQTDETGNYLTTLPIGKDYALNVNRKGYLFYSEIFSLSQKQPDSTYNINIPLQPLEANANIILKNIFFDVNKFNLKSESQIELAKIVQLLKENPTVKIEISGHTDNIGKPADNLKLSESRARSVVYYLITKGINPDRLSSKGLGDTKSIADNKTEEGRAKNRRTELKVISQ